MILVHWLVSFRNAGDLAGVGVVPETAEQEGAGEDGLPAVTRRAHSLHLVHTSGLDVVVDHEGEEDNKENWESQRHPGNNKALE